MLKLERYSLLISFNLSVFSMTFLIASAASSYWITAAIRNSDTLDGRQVTGSLHYGLYEGSMTLRGADIRRHRLYMSCFGFHCAVTCKTTAKARILYVMNIGLGYHSQSDECDDNGEVDMGRPLVSDRQTISSYLFYAINALLYMQLVFAGLSTLIAAVAILILESKLVHGLHCLMGVNFISVLLGLILLTVWGSMYATTLRYHLALSYLEAHYFEAIPAIGYSYWLVFLAVTFSIGSMVMAFIRAEYLRREMLKTNV